MKKKIIVLILLIGFSISLKSQNNELWGWGYLGNLTKAQFNREYLPIRIDNGNNWKQISLISSAVSALKEDGTLWAWKTDQPFEQDTIFNDFPTQISPDTDWDKIIAGYQYFFGIKKDGSLWAWGYNGISGSYGFETSFWGDGTTKDYGNPIRIGNENNWLEIVPGYLYNLALKKDGSLWGWGANYENQLGDGSKVSWEVPTRIGDETNWKYLSAGVASSYGIKKDGSLWAWGNNEYGQLGDGTKVNRDFPVRITKDNDWKLVQATGGFTFAIKNDGSLWGWGDGINNYNDSISLGNGKITKNNVWPLRIGIENDWVDIVKCIFDYYADTKSYTIAIKQDKSLWSWGYNGFDGALGIGEDIKYQLSPKKIEGIDNIVQVCATVGNVVVLKNVSNSQSISGQILDIDNKSITNVNINLSGQLTKQATTDNNGRFTFDNLQNGDYLVTPQPTNKYKFNPIAKISNLDNAKKSDYNVNFEALLLAQSIQEISLSSENSIFYDNLQDEIIINSFGTNEISNVKIFNSCGLSLFESDIQQNSSISTKSFTSGLYFIAIDDKIYKLMICK